MINKKLFTALLIFLMLLASVVVGCNGEEGTVSENGTVTDNGDVEVLELVFGHNDPVISVGSDAAELFAQIVEEESGGTMKIDVFPNNQLGSNTDLIEQTKTGDIDFTMGGICNLGDFMPEYNITMAMFVFEDQEHMRSAIEGELGQRLAQKLLDEHNLRMISQTWDRDTRQIVSNIKVVEPEDFVGVVIRAGYPGAEVPMRALGASPTQIPLNEMYTGFQQNIIDAVEMPWSYVTGESLYEVADYLIETDNTFATRFLAMSEVTYQKLTEEQREIIFNAAETAGIYNNQNTWAEIDDIKQALKDYGMEFVTPNRTRMIEIVKDSIDELEEQWGIEGLYDEIYSEQYTNNSVDYRNTAPNVKW